MNKCTRCEGRKFWQLSTGQERCSQCGLTRKFREAVGQIRDICKDKLARV